MISLEMATLGTGRLQRRRVAYRWQLAVMLHRNPSIQQYRKSKKDGGGGGGGGGKDSTVASTTFEIPLATGKGVYLQTSVETAAKRPKPIAGRAFAASAAATASTEVTTAGGGKQQPPKRPSRTSSSAPSSSNA